MKQKKIDKLKFKENSKTKDKRESFLQKVFRQKFLIAILLILFLATFLRFYNFQERWGIGDDSTRDIAIAREAIDRHELPMIGSFSSAGPFAFGPLFYWVLMASYVIFPFWFTAPIILTVLTSIATVGVLIVCGYLIGGKRLAILMGVLATTAPQLVARSIAIGQHSYVAISTACLFLFFILYWKRKNSIYAFLMGLALGSALSFHYQTINLLIFFAAVFFIPKVSLVKRIAGLISMGAGFLIPSLPLIIWDSQQQWANLRNILDYLLVAQYRLYVPNSWKLFLFKYLPSYWSFVVGGYATSALFLMIVTFIVVGVSAIKRKISGIMLAFGIIFAILLMVNKFYKGERSEGYLIYLSPFIILFTAWSIDMLLQATGKKIYVRLGQLTGVIVLLIILIGNFLQIKHYEESKNIKHELDTTISFLIKKYPDTKFVIYDYRNRAGAVSQPLGLFLKLQDKTDPKGMPIGFSCGGADCPQKLPVIAALASRPIVDMRSVVDRDKKSGNWVKVNQENMYDDLIGWSKKHELKATFSPQDYILQKFK